MQLSITIIEAFCRLLRARLTLRAGTAVESRMEQNVWNNVPKRIPLLEALSETEFQLVLLALLPQIRPEFLNEAILEAFPAGGDLPLLGGVKGQNHRGLLPTGETAIALLSDADPDEPLTIQSLLQPDALLAREGLLFLESLREGEPPMSGRLIIPQNIADHLLFGREPAPRFGPDFPAKQLTTAMNWDDVVLPQTTKSQVQDISAWLRHHDKLTTDSNLSRKIKPGYRVLFYGPPGTGKTLTAAMLGKEFGKPVYRVDLSQIVSKFIGETEKNLETVFRRAERQDWILFFDEADALFGKRTSVQSAHDKYANQEVSYLLQRVEDYAGLLILASNFKNNLDDAFVRRFQNIVHFPQPNAQERHLLWQKSLPASLPADANIDLQEIASSYELSGAGILNAVHYAVLRCYDLNETHLSLSGIIEGIRKEFLKEEKPL
ncbi:MAG: ATP-binding protein [Bacteroidetes bacterium]|nr:ATP-binding protein [Bacteroidota bacterium]MBS1630589.1 ATP-binding protein [Bacteroidota bacterium]